jgi:nucleoid DNA-binding protein
VAKSTGIEKTTIMIPESDVPSFKPGKQFKAAMKK